ncbi:MAG: hypothetical protein NTV32_08110 [Gammaproteobacteria bacterium]|nr:hypothetical protein [Gammaproteobacteria bacterium]
MMKQELNLQKYLCKGKKPRMIPFQFMVDGEDWGRLALDIFKEGDGLLILITYPAYNLLLSREALIKSILQLIEYNAPDLKREQISFYELYLSPNRNDPMGFHLMESKGSIEVDPDSFKPITPEASPFDLSDWQPVYPHKFNTQAHPNKETDHGHRIV